METAAKKIARLDRSIARAGETVTLRRLSVDAAGATATLLELADCPAWVRASQPQDLVEPGVTEHEVVLSATHLLGATIGSPAVAFGIPQRDDRIIIQGADANVQEIRPIYYGGSLVRVNLTCRGGGG